jgi:hypothetical protein
MPAAVVSLTASVALAGDPPTLWDLGSGFFPTDASGDGSVVVGDNFFTGEYFEWTAGTGIVDIGGQVAGSGVGGQASISDDAMRVSGTYLNTMSGEYEMSLYDRMSGMWTPLGGIGGSSGTEISSGWGISGDGLNTVGLGWIDAGGAHAIQWTEGVGTFDLGSTVPDRSSRANNVDFDGNVVVGWQDSETGFRQAAVWIDGVQTVIMTDAMEPVSEAIAVSADGQWVVGIGAFSTNDEAWRWSQATGLELLGSLGLPGIFPRGFATAISGDGSIIVGFDRPFGPPTSGEGWIWTEATGLMSLDDYFASLGLANPDNVNFSLPLGISADGRTFCGGGRSDSAFSMGWIVTIPPDDTVPAYVDIRTGACPNPFNRNGRGVLPINVLGTADFDVTQIDLSTVVLSRADGVGGSVAPNEGPPGPHSVYSDTGTPFDGEACDCHHAGADGIMDLRMKFRTDEMVAALELDSLPEGTDLELVVSGTLMDGTDFAGSDCVRIVPPGASNLMVESTWSDLYVQIDTPDLNLDDDGFAPFARWYADGTSIQLTAPPARDRRRFSLTWMLDGQPYSTASTITVDVGSVGRIEAVYTPRPSGDQWLDLANQMLELLR